MSPACRLYAAPTLHRSARNRHVCVNTMPTLYRFAITRRGKCDSVPHTPRFHRFADNGHHTQTKVLILHRFASNGRGLRPSQASPGLLRSSQDHLRSPQLASDSRKSLPSQIAYCCGTPWPGQVCSTPSIACFSLEVTLSWYFALTPICLATYGHW